jgi:hypothetical protein
MKFMALYMAPVAEMEKMMANSNSEDMNKGMDEWKQWMDAHKDSMVDMGGPLGKTKRVTQDGVTDAKNDIGAYTVVEAASAEEAANIFKDSPHFAMMPGAYIDVLPLMPMPGM